jgi:hypothetical protein
MTRGAEGAPRCVQVRILRTVSSQDGIWGDSPQILDYAPLLSVGRQNAKHSLRKGLDLSHKGSSIFPKHFGLHLLMENMTFWILVPIGVKVVR